MSLTCFFSQMRYSTVTVSLEGTSMSFAYSRKKRDISDPERTLTPVPQLMR